MNAVVDAKTAIIVPNWNGEDVLADCLDSLLAQSVPLEIIVVENGSVDGSAKLLSDSYPGVTVLTQAKNLGFAGGVNVGIAYALEHKHVFIGLLNNDATVDKDWAKHLITNLEKHPDIGIVTSKLLAADGKSIDSTGEMFSVWGLPYPRGRGETDLTKYDKQTEIFAASGGASLYRAALFDTIGLFDEDFFAYYEDVDVSFRAQLAGWPVRFEPKAIAYHQIGASSSKIKGFTTYQTMKNQPLLLLKNVPRKYMYAVGWRFTIAHILFYLRAISRGQFWIATKGDMKGTDLLFSGFKKRKAIQKTKTVSDEYIWNLIAHDLPTDAIALRKLRSKWRVLTLRGKRNKQ